MNLLVTYEGSKMLSLSKCPIIKGSNSSFRGKYFGSNISEGINLHLVQPHRADEDD